MKHLTITILFLLLLSGIGIAQKAPITDTTYKRWTTVEDGKISNDGNYVLYKIINQPLHGYTYVVNSTNNKWEYRSAAYRNPNFSSDSKYLYALSNDTLIQLKLNSSETIKIPNCKDYYLLNRDNNDWLIYQLNDVKHTLFVKNLVSEKIFLFSKVYNIILNPSTVSILFKTRANNNDENLHKLDLISGKQKIIYTGGESSQHIFDRSGQQLAFTTIKEGHKSLWRFENNLSQAVLLGNDESEGIPSDKKICTTDVWRFSNDGKDLFFTLSNILPNKENKSGPDIWNYKDAFLLSTVKRSGYFSLHRGENLTVIHIKQNKIVQLLSGNQKVIQGWGESQNNNVLIVESSYGDGYELAWNYSSRKNYYLCFTQTGKIVSIKKNCSKAITQMVLSPNNRHLVYFDPESSSYISYDIELGITEYLFKIKNSEQYLLNVPGNGKIEGWIEETEKLIIRDNYSLWLLDAENKNTPCDLTNCKGNRNMIAFAIGEPSNYGVYSNHKDILVNGFDLVTKDQAIFKLNLSTRRFTEIFRDQTWFNRAYTLIPNPVKFLKAKNANKYLLRIESVSKSPNYKFTSDFKNYIPISNNNPESNYNWLTSELIHYKDKLGNDCEGILYKPENFNPSQKYPVVFNYYLAQSDALNQYLSPEPSSDGINIPLLVSNGYLVCVPNIYQDGGTLGESSLIYVTAAANYLSRFRWADSMKFALAGHSLGGFETNYILTRTNKFAAAFSAAGVSNLIADYNQTMGSGSTTHMYVEGPGYFMGKGLQDIPDSYILNSPILFAKNIETPLLLLHNNEDHSVAVDHSLQLFIQLRSLGKAVWLLQYENEGHMLINELNQIDSQNKVQSFFDHYLKGKELPEWMDKHI